MIEKVRLSQRKQVILLLGSVLDPGSEFLTAAGKCRPVKKIEIALSELDESEQALYRAEACPEVECAGPFLLHLDEQILAARDPGVLGISIHFLEIAEVIESLLAGLDTNRVEDIAGKNEDFAAEHLVLGASIPRDVDPFDKGALALVDVVGEIDHTRAGGGSLRQDIDINKAARTVTVGDRF